MIPGIKPRTWHLPEKHVFPWAICLAPRFSKLRTQIYRALSTQPMSERQPLEVCYGKKETFKVDPLWCPPWKQHEGQVREEDRYWKEIKSLALKESKLPHGISTKKKKKFYQWIGPSWVLPPPIFQSSLEFCEMSSLPHFFSHTLRSSHTFLSHAPH